MVEERNTPRQQRQKQIPKAQLEIEPVSVHTANAPCEKPLPKIDVGTIISHGDGLESKSANSAHGVSSGVPASQTVEQQQWQTSDVLGVSAKAIAPETSVDDGRLRKSDSHFSTIEVNDDASVEVDLDDPITVPIEAVKKAKKYRDSTMAKVLHREPPGYQGLGGKQYPLNVPAFSADHPDLSDIGLGVSLYFETLRTLGWTMAGVFLLALPGVIIPFLANPRAAAEAQRSGGALGALRSLTVTGMFKSSAANPYGCDVHTCTLRTGSVVDTLPLVSAIVYLDLAYSLILLAAFKLLRMRCATRVREVEREGVSAADYAVVVWGLPPDASSEEIRVHFNRIAAMDAQGAAKAADVENDPPGADGGVGESGVDREGGAGEVAAVHIARREGISLGAWRRLAKLQVALRRVRAAADRRRSRKGEEVGDAAGQPAADKAAAPSGAAETAVDKKLAALQLRVKKQEDRVRRMLESGSAGRAVCAFVVFERAAARVACLRRYSSQSIWSSLGCCFCPSKFRLRDRFALTVKPAPEPSDVLWENLECGKLERMTRRFVCALAMLVLVALALMVIVVDKTFAEQLRDSRSECADPAFAAMCNAAVPWNSTVSAAIASAGLGAGCSSNATPRLSQLWGACGLAGGDGIKFPPGPVPAPLVVNTSVVPAEPLLLAAVACRYRGNGSWIEGARIPQACSTAADVTAQQWAALVAAGWAGASSPAGGGGFVNASRCEACQCEALMDASPELWWDSLDAGPHRGGIRSPGGGAPCSGQASSLAMFTALQGVAIALVIGLNLLLYVAVDRLATAERHHGVVGHEAAVALGIFAAQFANTFLVALLVYARIDSVRAHLPSSTGPASFLPLFAGPFPDFTDQWAAVVGAQILTTVMLNAVIPLARLLLAIVKRMICLPLAAMRVGPAWTQRELNRRYEGDKFSLARRYGRLLNIVFGCLLLSSEMPVLLLAAAFILGLTEMIDRVYLLRLCRLPPRHSHRLSDTALDMLDFAVAVHLCVGCWVFSATNSLGTPMFPRPASVAVEQAGAVLLVAGLDVTGARGINCTLLKTTQLCSNGTAKDICQWNKAAGVCSSLPAVSGLGTADPLSAAPRLLNGLMLPYLLITLVVVMSVIVRHTFLWRIAKHFTACVCGCFVRKKSLESDKERPNYSDALKKGLFGNIPSTYDLQEIPPYDEVFDDRANRRLRKAALARWSGQPLAQSSFSMSASFAQSVSGDAAGIEAAEKAREHVPLEKQLES